MPISKWNGQSTKASVLRLAEDKMKRAVIEVERVAKRKAPVNKYKGGGELRDSITYEVTREGDSIFGRVGTSVPYSIYQEFGTGIYAEGGDGRKTPWVYPAGDGKFFWTKGNRPQPYLRPALHESEKFIRRVFGGGK